MADKPIIFSAPMIRALLEGRKTQTRRVIKWQGPKGFPHFFDRAFVDNPAGIKRLCVPYHHPDDADDEDDNPAHRHYTSDPGDRLWVRETWQACEACSGVSFAATVNKPKNCTHCDASLGKWRPSIFMPRWASRLTLIVTSVRVERLQEISKEDARAEGTQIYGRGNDLTPIYIGRDDKATISPRDGFAALWNSINGPGAWDANPWVAAYTFTVHKANIDALTNPDPSPAERPER
jgi:hypothetical protein